MPDAFANITFPAELTMAISGRIPQNSPRLNRSLSQRDKHHRDYLQRVARFEIEIIDGEKLQPTPLPSTALPVA
jgi:hypothetical protein